MKADPQSLYAEAMRLPIADREELAARLMGQVSAEGVEDAKLQDAWRDEIRRRIADSEAGRGRSVPIEEVWFRVTGKPWA